MIDPISFWFDRKVKLTSLKVIPVLEIQTNKFPQPIWNLVSDSNSVPVKQFTYGMRIQGMRSGFERHCAGSAGARSDLPADCGSRKQKMQHDFTPEPRTE